MKTPTTLIIMDGFGLEGPSAGNAVVNAPTPNLDRIFRDFPGCRLSASGLDVGLPEGQMGNSEVGHTNMGAGRVVFQDLPHISRDIESGEDVYKRQVVMSPADDVEAKAAVKAAYAHQGPVYLRFGRLAVPVLHEEMCIRDRGEQCLWERHGRWIPGPGSVRERRGCGL